LGLFQSFQRAGGIVDSAGGFFDAVAHTVEGCGLPLNLFDLTLCLFKRVRKAANSFTGGADRARKLINCTERNANAKIHRRHPPVHGCRF
ncbi:hypothetical protein RZN32_32255, partial [Klebsiella pneumoniae]|nr:hypothetical protein [Klebsiella pneumoniae]